jgi:hypothetical protein
MLIYPSSPVRAGGQKLDKSASSSRASASKGEQQASAAKGSTAEGRDLKYRVQEDTKSISLKALHLVYPGDEVLLGTGYGKVLVSHTSVHTLASISCSGVQDFISVFPISPN